MKIDKLSAETQRTINAIAKAKGLTPDEVIARFRAIFLRQKVSRHSSVFS